MAENTQYNIHYYLILRSQLCNMCTSTAIQIFTNLQIYLVMLFDPSMLIFGLIAVLLL